MATVVVEPHWVEKFKSISKDEINSPTKICKSQLFKPASKIYTATNDDEYDHHGVSHEDVLKRRSENNKIISEQRERRMERMRSLFISQPKLETICKDWINDFVDSGFITYKFCDYTFKYQEAVPDDLSYMINLCGCNLTHLYINGYCHSQIMPLIKSNCSNLEELLLTFVKMESKHFEDAFSNMSHLKKLTIDWKCKDLTLPMTLVKSFEQVRETLTKLAILCNKSHQFYPFGLPDSSIAIFSQVNEALMTTVENMRNLEHLTIRWAYGVTDEFLINLVDNAINLKDLCISGSRITDKGIIALNKLSQLEYFDLEGMQSQKENKFITDESIQRLCSKTIRYLDISKCIQVTNSSVVELFKHLPNLEFLNLKNTQVNLEGILEIAALRKCHDNEFQVNTSFEIDDDLYESLLDSKFICIYIPDDDDDDLNED